MKTTPDEEHDQPHTGPLWFAHERDQWGRLLGRKGRTSVKRFTRLSTKSNPAKTFGLIRSHNKWVDHDGKVILTDDRSIRIYSPKKPRGTHIGF